MEYIGGLLATMSIVDEPTAAQLAVYSKTGLCKIHPWPKERETVFKRRRKLHSMKVGDASPIKYVFYVIKENHYPRPLLGDILKEMVIPLVLFGKNH